MERTHRKVINIYLSVLTILITSYSVLNFFDYFPREKSRDFRAAHNLVLAMVKIGQIEEAERVERIALTWSTGGSARIKYKGHILLAVMEMEKGNDEAAMQNLKASLILHPRDLGAYKLMARIYYKYGAKQNAAEVLKIALNIDVNDAEGWAMLREVQA